MADLSSVTSMFEAQMNQTMQEQNARMERLNEMERIRLERTAARAAQFSDASSRHNRRDTLIRQATQQRTPDRRSSLNYLQRTPVARSQSFDTPAGHDEIGSYRDTFDSARFGSRGTGSNESLTSGSLYSRRTSDTPGRLTTEARSPVSGILDEVNATLFGSNSSITREIRSSSITRENRDVSSPTQRFLSSSPSASTLARSSSLRESRSRFRRRTIQGVDSNVREALERERQSPVAIGSSARSERLQNTVNGSSYKNETGFQPYSSYTSTFDKIELYPEDGMPMLSLVGERTCFVDPAGHIRWLDKSHRLLRMIRTTDRLPELIIKDKNEVSSVEKNGVVEDIDGEADVRYDKLREMITTLQRRLKKFDRGNSSDSSEEDLNKKISSIYDEIHTFISFYSPPRPRQNIEEYCKSRPIVPLYDGIKLSDDETENTDMETSQSVDQQVPQVAGTESNNNDNNSNNYEEMMNGETFSYSAPESRMDVTETISEEYVSPEGRRITESQSSCPDSVTMQDEVMTLEDVPSDISLVVQRISMMGGGEDGAIDASHLDIEEMRMIQRALEENPSPPESPRNFDEVIMSPTVQETPVSSESASVAAVSPVSSSTAVTTSATSTAVRSSSSSGSSTAVLVPSPKLISPVSQRPPSESGESRLPLPTMDFSPLKKNSPKNSSVFTYPESSSDRNQSSEDPSTTAELTSPTRRKTTDQMRQLNDANNEFQSGTEVDYNKELSIDIPGTSPSSANQNVSDNQMEVERSNNNQLSESPSVKSKSSSRTGSEAASPAGSETVTTVFEEFVSTIPQEYLNNMSPTTPPFNR